jgi:hypothetical protein
MALQNGVSEKATVFRTCATIVTRSDSAAMVCGSPPPPLTPPPYDARKEKRQLFVAFSFSVCPEPVSANAHLFRFAENGRPFLFLAHRSVLKSSRPLADVAVVMLELLHHTHQRLRHLHEIIIT